NLPAGARRELGKHQAELAKRVRRLVEAFGDVPARDKVEIEPPSAIEPSRGEGLGAIVAGEEGERFLDEFAVARRLEDWAGPVAGATELHRNYGIPRSTLNRWQHAGEVIALLKGTKKHVYPIEQFVDGRPVRYMAAIGALATSQRVAWLWLRQPNP